MFALSSSKKIPIIAFCAAALVMVTSVRGQDDPPPEAGRISYISGNVSVQAVSSDDWGQAYPNLPLGPGDRIYTDSDGRAEIQVGQTYIRVGPNTDITLVDDSQFNINVGVAQGSIRLHSYRMWPRQLLDVSTPNGNAEFANSGDLRIDVMPNDGATVFTNLGQFADITAAGDYRQELDYGQSLELAGSNPVYPQWLQPAGPDDLDSWSQERDQHLSRVVSFQYVSPDIPGAADLDAYGDWQPATEYGAVWFPRDVPADWQPYHYGHWIDRDPWGWVWVEDESWGYAPFHYGRWVNYENRWGWVPGPVNVRPVWSPALVVFAGGVHFGGGGGGLSVWFPLGPGEAYRPWYRCSPQYIDRVNITNIREAPRVHVQNTYVNVVNVTNITYVNQTRGATAMRQDDFAQGRSVRNVAVRVDPREMQQARALQQPQVAPSPRAIVSRPVARPVPVSVQRPNLINQQGRQIVARPGATPVAPPVRQQPQIRPLPGRTIVAAPAPNRGRGNQMPVTQGSQDQRPNAPNSPYPGGAPRANPVAPVQGTQRPINPQLGNPQVNQNPPANNNQQQRPQPVAPGVQPTGRPVQPPNYQQQDRQNPMPDNNERQPQDRQPVAPGVQPNGRPVPPPPNTQQPARPSYQQPNNQPPNYQQQPRPNQQQPPNPAPPQNRQEFGPTQPNRHQDVTPLPPANSPPQSRPVQPPPQQREVEPPPQSRPVQPPPQQRDVAPPPQRPTYQPQERQAPPPPNRQADQPRPRQDAAPRQPNPPPNNQKQNNNKDSKKDEKKDEKKPQ
ncbi:hypothetical protein P8935_23965 [Telmatobacter sp. DSM 110680]|uniref:FecR protein domain-containing protein n=1 Tax=Telmatobacter sp. DSM 110680 TaxID=3036704 RepID=A0AAU7DLG7_9BACT